MAFTDEAEYICGTKKGRSKALRASLYGSVLVVPLHFGLLHLSLPAVRTVDRASMPLIENECVLALMQHKLSFICFA